MADNEVVVTGFLREGDRKLQGVLQSQQKLEEALLVLRSGQIKLNPSSPQHILPAGGIGDALIGGIFLNGVFLCAVLDNKKIGMVVLLQSFPSVAAPVN